MERTLCVGPPLAVVIARAGINLERAAAAGFDGDAAENMVDFGGINFVKL